MDENQGNAGPDIDRTAAQLGVLLGQIFRIDGGRQLRAFEESGVSMVQLKILLSLLGPGKESEAATGSDLAERMGVSGATISRAIDGLVEAGMVERREDPEDRRRRTLAVTDSGRHVIERVNAARIAGIRDFVARLSDEERSFLDAATGRILERPDMESARRFCQGLIDENERRLERSVP